MQRNILRAYNIICDGCAEKEELCCKCGEKQQAPIERPVPNVEKEREQAQFENDIKLLRERERRKFFRLMKQGISGEEALAQVTSLSKSSSNPDDEEEENDDDFSDIDDEDF